MHRLLNRKHNRLIYYAQKLIQKTDHSSTVDTIDAFSYLNKNKNDSSLPRIGSLYNNFSVKPSKEMQNKESIDLTKLSGIELDNLLLELLNQNKDKEIFRIINECLDKKITIGKDALKKLFRMYSVNGNVEAVELLKNYCSRMMPALYKNNGEFLHYVAKAQCMKGNSEKGLSLLTDAYRKYPNYRGFYRIILKELIHDSVMNRSEATLVIFKRYIIEFSTKWQDSYPLVCLWHVCWKSDWFSDQMLADELLDSSESLQNILAEMSSTLCLSILKEYNDDAVARLLQSLLKYKMMDEYANVLQILFNFKLKNKDIRGCTEILRNCEVLGVSLPSYLQSQFIKLLIGKKDDKPVPSKATNFKLKF